MPDDSAAFVLRQNVIFGRGPFAEITAGKELGDQDRLDVGRVRVEGDELEDEAGSPERKKRENFAVKILARALHVFGRVDHLGVAFLSLKYKDLRLGLVKFRIQRLG